ncbi:glycoside hydrolase family 81 protein [Chaetomium sp. MPI-SDFR-AT-0129]|nr:glycoside hydrolase family 81 protein [Chaetomium sp. MPI-SDFR-AT-0129]
MGRIWRLAAALLTALQVVTSLPVSEEDRNNINRYPSSTTLPAHLPAKTVQAVAKTPAKVITSVGPDGTVQILPSRTTPAPGFIPSELETLGHVTACPLLTDLIPEPTVIISISLSISVGISFSMGSSSSVPTASSDIFADPISTDAPLANFARKDDHPVPRQGITNKNGPIGTNKFYNNFHLGNQTTPAYLHPYSVAWARGQGAAKSWGLAVSHIDAQQRVYGQASPGTGAVSYFINPIGIQSVILSAKELGSGTVLTTDALTDFSAQVNLLPNTGGTPAVRFPLVQGSGFITALYDGAVPVLQTGVYYRTVTRATTDPKQGITKYKLVLEDGATWLVYAYHSKGDPLDLEVVDNTLAQAKGPFSGTIQVTKDPGGGEAVFDKACGAYPTGVQLSGSVSGASGSYTLAFQKAGLSDTALAMFALPHHQDSFDGATKGKVTSVKLQTTTKGIAAAVVADSWTLVESNLPTNIGFLPWTPQTGSLSTLSDATKQFIHTVAQQEVSQNILDQTDQNSMYFSGKALAKFASLIVATKEMLDDQGLAQAGLDQLKKAFSRFAQNTQQYPLVYESAWGGIVSSATYSTGDTGADFGNTLYNDHHFHWGYFIYTAAAIGHLDPSWIDANKAYVNLLVRDIANPSTQDSYFPLWRSFDWFHGHSWAHGLFDTLDGKDQESSSEDTMHAYALKMWGSVVGDANLEARGNLMLAVQGRSLRSYYLYTSANTVQPHEFIGNKAAGILFENKIDHTTYFGTNIEFIQGIHMLPLLPHTPFIRTPDFVREEWDTYFSQGRVDAIQGGWKGVLWGNYATIDPKGAYTFFSGGGAAAGARGEHPNKQQAVGRAGFDPGWLDGGASLTWYLCYSAGEYSLHFPLCDLTTNELYCSVGRALSGFVARYPVS